MLEVLSDLFLHSCDVPGLRNDIVDNKSVDVAPWSPFSYEVHDHQSWISSKIIRRESKSTYELRLTECVLSASSIETHFAL